MAEGLQENMQLIDYDGTFLGDVDAFLKKEKMSDKGFNYNVITVLGCQSSGKSTLLNRLFNTNFQVMDALQGRGQTTKGLWMSVDHESPTVIIDVEGTDSKERGEDRLTFEHRAALFSLALADCVVVNMWYHDLGRYTASNYGLLKTVMAVNLELFAQQASSQRTTMLFVIRDHIEAQTPLAALKTMILNDIRNIWREIKKPPQFENTDADIMFDFQTVGLPSKFMMESAFNEKTTELKTRWLEELRPKEYSRKIPADGFAYYCKSVWDTILKSSDLDIPSQKEMLASYRCEEIKNAVLLSLQEELGKKTADAAAKEVSDLPEWTAHIFKDAIEKYTEPAQRYEESVFMKKREQLTDTLFAETQKVVDLHLSHVRSRITHEGQKALDTKLGGLDRSSGEGVARFDVWKRFAETCEQWKGDLVKQFETAASACSVHLPGCDKPRDFHTQSARDALCDGLDTIIEKQKQAELSEVHAYMQAAANKELSGFDLLLANSSLSSEDFWSKSTDLTKEVYLKIVMDLEDTYKGMGLERAALDEDALKETVGQVRARLDRLVDYLDVRMAQRFNAHFQTDEQGAPRHWPSSTPEAIQKIFVVAKNKGLEMLDMFSSVKLDLKKITDNPPTSLLKKLALPLLDDRRKAAVESRGLTLMQKACQEALVIQTTGGVATKIPLWLWGALVILGWNEFVAVISSPFTLILCLLACAFAGFCYLTGNMTLPLKLLHQSMGLSTTVLLPLVHTLHKYFTEQAETAIPSSTPVPVRKRRTEEEKQD
eukprot:GDKI01015731.1.p1 GENE.GDKI01015731.1~~GDKI01015731.1.p1  ORF type:complete len:771 (+),score=270.52 GDKI01015731.1:36-2348(+)